MKYGTFLSEIEYKSENKVDTIKNKIKQSRTQKLFCDYFGNPIFIKKYNTSGVSHYYAEVNTKLLNEHRYVILIVDEDNYNIDSKFYMSDINWKGIQFRSLRENKQVYSTFNYIKNTLFTNVILKIISVVNTTNPSYTSYKNEDLSIEVFVFHTNQNRFYPDGVTLASAIETYQTIVNLK